MRKLLVITSVAVLLASGCASFGTEGDKTASLMTQTPHPKTLDRQGKVQARRAAAAEREARRQSGYVSPEPMSRSERAIEVLRRSRFTRWVFPARSLGPSNPGPGTGGMVGSGSASPTAQAIPGTSPVTTVPGPTPMPGEGRIVIGRSRDAGTGIKSSVTGTPVEQVPGGMAGTTVIAAPSTGVRATSGTAAAAAAPPATTTAPRALTTQPAATTKPSSEPIVIERNPDGTPVIKNVDEEETSSTKKPN